MTSEICFSDSEAEFSFKQGDSHFTVRTEVAKDSFARVVVSEQCEQEEQPMEGTD